jgi:hypothetical protein
LSDATRDDSLGPDATWALPVYRRLSPGGIRYASSGVISGGRAAGTSGVPRVGWGPDSGEPRSRPDQDAGRSLTDMPSPYWMSIPYGMPGQAGMPEQDDGSGQYEAPEGESSWPADQAGADWSVPEPEPEPEPGWFGRRHPDLWVFGGGALVAAAAMVAAFAAASGATATGYAQTSQTTTTHAPAQPTSSTREGAAPAMGSACLSPASTGAGR